MNRIGVRSYFAKPTGAGVLLALAMMASHFQPAFALITGGEGNSPLPDPGWPNGAAEIFNHPGRIAYWEGPPFGGGQWHAECRGDAKAFYVVAAKFARLDVKNKRIVVHNGIGHSIWLHPNREHPKDADVDWAFTVWQPASRERLRKLPVDINPTADDDSKDPPAQLDVYVGGRVPWCAVLVPEGLAVRDERLEAHGFKLTDGNVIEGRIFDFAKQRPLAANVRLEQIQPQPKGGYRYKIVAGTVANAQGRWLLKKIPAGWHRIVVAADGFVPRVAGYDQSEDGPRWSSVDCGLARAGSVAGRVVDGTGKPLAGVKVSLRDVVSGKRGRYESPDDYTGTTKADGRFQLDNVPVGTAAVWVDKAGYCRPGLGPSITTPTRDVTLTMVQAAALRVTVQFKARPRPQAYLVEIEPEGKSGVGTWGGGGQVDAKGQSSFKDVPPGRYVLKGRPNPSSANDVTEPLTVELTGGEQKEVTLEAK